MSHPGDDVVEGGRPEGPGRRPAWRLLLAAVVVVAGIGAYQWFVNRPPTTPTVTITAHEVGSLDPRGTGGVDPAAGSDVGPQPVEWTHGDDGRPTGLLTVRLLTSVTATGGASVADVAGVSGPGVRFTGAAPALTKEPLTVDGPQLPLVGGSQEVALQAEVDCTEVRMPPDPRAYRLRLHLREGAREADVGVPMEQAAAQSWAARLGAGCEQMLVRRDVTVTAVSATVDPMQPEVSVALTVVNNGRYDVVVRQAAVDARKERVSGFSLRLRSGEENRAEMKVLFRQCPAWPSDFLPVTTVETPLPLTASLDVGSPLLMDRWAQNLGEQGIVLGPAAARDLRAAVIEACGGVETVYVLEEAAARRAHTVDLTVKVVLSPEAGGRVRLVQGSGGYGVSIADTPWAGLSADHSARLRVTVLAPAERCAEGEVQLDMALEARLPALGGTRTVSWYPITPASSLVRCDAAGSYVVRPRP